MARAAFDQELEELRQKVDCRVLLERDGWALVAGESTRGAAKYRETKGKRIVIVTHEGRGWFDAKDDLRGDVFALSQYLWPESFGRVRRRLRPLAGITPSLAELHHSTPAAPLDAGQVWGARPVPKPGSQGWSYMLRDRGLPGQAIERALHAGVLREGVYGTLWAAHRNADGAVIGWEMRGPQYKGFSKGGSKGLFWVGNIRQARRVAVAEAWIDALSLGVLEGWPEGTAYASTGGGYGPLTAEILAALVPPTARLVAASDTGHGGDVLAKRLRALADGQGWSFGRRRPEDKDWNLDLKNLAAGHVSPPLEPVRPSGKDKSPLQES